MPSKFLDPQYKDLSPGYLLLHAGSRWQREITKVLEPFNLTHGQFILLSFLYKLGRENDYVTQNMLVLSTGYEFATISSMVSALMKKRYVVKKGNPLDSRANAISITVKGKAQLRPAARKITVFEKDFFHHVRGKKIFGQALKTIING